ncbi:NAD(P)H-dependent flavin oxidoreductase [Chloroflexota bacterium]
MSEVLYVIGDGGFGDARGFLACLALGAEGVLMGTRFMLTKECTLHREYKKALLEAQETSTVLIQRSLNNPSRVLRNKLADEILDMEKRGTTLEELLPFIRGDRALEARARGDIDHGIIHCGQVIGLIDDEPTVKEVVDSIINGAREIQKRLEATYNPM